MDIFSCSLYWSSCQFLHACLFWMSRQLSLLKFCLSWQKWVKHSFEISLLQHLNMLPSPRNKRCMCIFTLFSVVPLNHQFSLIILLFAVFFQSLHVLQALQDNECYTFLLACAQFYIENPLTSSSSSVAVAVPPSPYLSPFAASPASSSASSTDDNESTRSMHCSSRPHKIQCTSECAASGKRKKQCTQEENHDSMEQDTDDFTVFSPSLPPPHCVCSPPCDCIVCGIEKWEQQDNLVWEWYAKCAGVSEKKWRVWQ